MKISKKMIALMMSLMLIIGGAAGGTIAWLMDTTDPITNTFTTSDVDIELAETTGNTYKMVPGDVIEKDPKITVNAGSEACYLFVKIEKTGNYDTYLEEYSIAGGWTELEAGSGVYYRTVDANQTGSPYYVLGGTGNGSLTVKNTVTKADMALIDGVADSERTIEEEIADRPTLKFTAYAIQPENLTDTDTDGDVDPIDAWTLINS